MRIAALIALSGVCLGLISCNKKTPSEMAPMGESAPAFGSGSLTTMQAFVVGRWCIVDPMGGIKPNRYFEFKSDGTFETGVKEGDYTSTGKWVASADSCQLTYETMKGKPFEAFRAEYKKDEEGGGQVAVQRALFYDGLYDELSRMTTVYVDEDGKHLSFSRPQPAPAPGSEGEEGSLDLSKLASYGLERMAAKKAEG